MAPSLQTLSEIRFGYGFRPGQTGANGPDDLMAGLGRKDPYLDDGRIVGIDDRLAWLRRMTEAAKARRTGAAEFEALKADVAERYLGITFGDARGLVARPLMARAAFRERLVAFWTDHFTVVAGNRRVGIMAADMIETAIRPNVTRSFADMLRAVTLHPAMLAFLNQDRSVGPNSALGQKRKAGLNENLAREILELHTLGVGAKYSQDDVRQFAELLTGASIGKEGFVFRPQIAEPGAETVLGTSYGGGKKETLGAIHQVLDDLAVRPETARHIARKLVVHFIGGEPDKGHVDSVARAFAQSDGALLKVYEALLGHENAWRPDLLKAKTPFDFMVSSLRAVGVGQREIMAMKTVQFRRLVIAPLVAMGQPFLKPNGPDGWSEDPADWITPAGLAARIKWCSALAQNRARDTDPRVFLGDALHDAASDLLARAVAGAETKHEGVAIVLASPEFNRR